MRGEGSTLGCSPASVRSGEGKASVRPPTVGTLCLSVCLSVCPQVAMVLSSWGPLCGSPEEDEEQAQQAQVRGNHQNGPNGGSGSPSGWGDGPEGRVGAQAGV